MFILYINDVKMDTISVNEGFLNDAKSNSI